MKWSLYRSGGLPRTFQMKCQRVSCNQEGGVCLSSCRLAYALLDGKTKIQNDKLTHFEAGAGSPGLSLKGVHLMSKNAVERKVEIKLGNVVYQVEREFIGTVSREEILVNRLLESKKRSELQDNPRTFIRRQVDNE